MFLLTRLKVMQSTIVRFARPSFVAHIVTCSLITDSIDTMYPTVYQHKVRDD